ncbi:MAG: hypothetical protein HYU41_16370 [Candidatus Rokubacteria bacterium]|nr:hypothetical protein [Candidatus Rokubacteria bacterium]
MDVSKALAAKHQRELAAFLVRLRRTADALEAALRESGRLERSRRRRVDRRASGRRAA